MYLDTDSELNMSNTFAKKMMKSKTLELIDAIQIDENYIVAVYKGRLSDLDILIKYKEKKDNKWTRARTPKHIHWTVDMLIKQYNNTDDTQNLLSFLIRKWDEIKSIANDTERDNILQSIAKIRIPKQLKTLHYGIYSIKFLFMLAFLLMKQEKTNRNDAYMFKKLLISLKEQKDLFEIISIATHH